MAEVMGLSICLRTTAAASRDAADAKHRQFFYVNAVNSVNNNAFIPNVYYHFSSNDFKLNLILN